MNEEASQLVDRIAELEIAAASQGSIVAPSSSEMTRVQRQRTIEALEQWLDSIRRSRRS